MTGQIRLLVFSNVQLHVVILTLRPLEHLDGEAQSRLNCRLAEAKQPVLISIWNEQCGARGNRELSIRERSDSWRRDLRFGCNGCDVAKAIWRMCDLMFFCCNSSAGFSSCQSLLLVLKCKKSCSPCFCVPHLLIRLKIPVEVFRKTMQYEYFHQEHGK